MARTRLPFLTIVMAVVFGLLQAVPARAAEQTEIEILVVKANFALKEENYEKALEFSNKALEGRPQNADAMGIKGRALFELGQTEQALEVFRALEKRNPADQSWRVPYGMTLLKLNKPGEAVKQLEKAVEAEPQNGMAWYNLGYARYLQGRHEKAVPAFKKAVEFGANPHEANYYLGRSYYELARYGEARQHFAKAVEVEPEGKLAGQSRRGLQLIDEAGPAAAAVSSADDKAWRARARLGFAFDSNVTITPADSTPITGDEKDVRTELSLSASYSHDLDDSSYVGVGYAGLFNFQHGAGDANSDFTLFNNDVRAFAGTSSGKLSSRAMVDYVVTTLGNIHGEDAPGRFQHQLFIQQLVGTLEGYQRLDESWAVGLFAQYARDWFEDIGPISASVRDGNNFQGGVRLLWSEQSDARRMSYGVLTLSGYARVNDQEDQGFSYAGPRLVASALMPLNMITENLYFEPSLFYALEIRYDDPNNDDRVDSRMFATLRLLYDLTDTWGVDLYYRAEGLVSNADANDPSYHRHVASLGVFGEF